MHRTDATLPAEPGTPGRSGRPGRIGHLVEMAAIGGVVVVTAGLGLWAAAPGSVSAAPAGSAAGGSHAALAAGRGHRAGHATGVRSSGTPGAPSGTTHPPSPGTWSPRPAAATPTVPASPSATPNDATPGGATPGGDGDTSAPAPAAPPSVPSSTTTPTPAPAPPAPTPTPTPTAGILPPDNPPNNIAPAPDFLTVCSGTAPDSSAACTQEALDAIDNGRAAEGVGPMVLPSDWASLTPAEQLFVATNLERTARGLAPLTGLDPSLDQAAAAGAAAGADPAPPAGYPYTLWASNWAGAVGNPLEAIYLWMYDDGPGSDNVDCPTAGASGCWGHRDNILVAMSCTSCAMGTALDPTGWNGDPAWAELLVEADAPVSTDFTWSQVTPYLPAGEA